MPTRKLGLAQQRLVTPEPPACRASVLDCGSPLPLSDHAAHSQSRGELPPSRTPIPQTRPTCNSPTRGNRICHTRTDKAPPLAERGYVVLAPSYPIMAGYQPDLNALGYQSGTMKAIWDNIRGLDLLDSLPFVRKKRFGAIGHSLGGHNAIYTAFFDPRIQVVVSSCGFDSFLDYYGGDPANWQSGRGWCQTRYLPRLADYRGRLAEIPFDFHELIGALAPRPVFVSAPLHDANFRCQSVDQVMKAASAVYLLYGVPQNLAVVHPDCEHDFPPEVREAAYRFLDQRLR